MGFFTKKTSSNIDKAGKLRQQADDLCNGGNYAKAEPLYRQALQLLEQTPDADDDDVFTTVYCLATALSKQGKFKEAEPLYRRSIDAVDPPQSHEQAAVLAVLLGEIAETLQHLGKSEEAEQFRARQSSMLSDEPVEDPDATITLIAADGAEYQAVVQQILPFDGKQYAVLTTIPDESCVVMRFVESGESATFQTIDDDDESEKVFAHINTLREEAERRGREIQSLRDQGDVLMRSRDFHGAANLYEKAWSVLVSGQHNYHRAEAFWLLLSLADAKLSSAKYEDSFDVLVGAFNNFRELAIGNPYFHLRVGQAKYYLNPQDDSQEAGSSIDEFARALIGGGIEIFDGEDAHFLSRITGILKPPQGFKSWEATRGHYEAATRDKLSTASGYPASVIKQRIPM